MRRTFIAVNIEPSQKLKEDYDLMRYRLRLERINWVSSATLHITLNFLGNTAEELLPGIVQCVDGIASRNPCLELTLRSLGVFKSLREPHIIWAGCDPCPALGMIKKELDGSLAEFGFEPENRVFFPHLTLGRVKEIRQINQLAQLITAYKDSLFQIQKVTSLTLYESKLTAAGPQYLPLKVFMLHS